MLKLFLRFSRRQKIVVGFFTLAAIVGTVLAFLVDPTVLLIGLFWLQALSVFLMIMFFRRFNAKMTRLMRGRAAARPAKAAATSRVAPGATLEQLRAQHARRATPATAAALSRKLIQEKGDISGAHQIMETVRTGSGASEGDQDYLRRVDSLQRLLHDDVELPCHNRSYNYVPRRNKVMYAVGMSPVSVNNGYTSRTRGVAGGLTAQGMDVIVTPLPGKPWDKKALDRFTVPKEHRRYRQVIDGVTYSHNPGLPAWQGDLDVFFQVSADAYVREAMIEKPEFILAASNYLNALPALIAARRLGVPFVYEMRGFWEVSAASVRPGWAESDQYQLDRRLEFLVADQADRVVVITEEMRQDLIARGIDAEKISVAPNCVDAQEFAPLGKDGALLRRLGFNDPELPVIGFAGSVTDYEGLDLVAEALSELKSRGRRFNLLIMGAGAYLADLQDVISRLGLDPETRYVSGIPGQQMPVYLSSIDIFPLARKSLPVTELVSPLKPLEAMSVGGAVVLSDVSPHLVFAGEDQQRALTFHKDDVADLAAQLDRLLADPEERRAMGVRARSWVKENRQWTVAGQALRDSLVSVREQNEALDDAPADVGADQTARERPLKEFTVAFIGDTFTSETFLPELTAVRVTPEDWRAQLAEHEVDALFIESAWQGNDRAWEGIIGYYDDETHAPIVELIEHCRASGIATMFWNKEDPVHFNRFKRTAALCDYVFTTDARTIVDYNALPDNVIKTVASAPFAAQPRLHNPLPSTREQEEAISYGGTYYGDKYATRKQGLDFLFYESAPYGLAIYERVHNDPNSPYRLPDRFRRFARQSLSYPEMCQAYKAHPIHLNGNSVVDSPSMFSRRVVEITASGSNVLSSPGRGVDETLAGAVPTVSTPDEANRQLKAWKGSEEQRHRDLWKALRHVNQAHTCAHRLTYMMRVAGFPVRSPQRPAFAIQCSAADVAAFERQSIRPDLYLVTDGAGDVTASVPVLERPADLRAEELTSRGIDHVIIARDSVGTLSQWDVEDLVTALRFGDWTAVGKRVVRWSSGEPHLRVAALNADLNDQLVLYTTSHYAAIQAGQAPTLGDDEVFAWQVVKDEAAAEPTSSAPAVVEAEPQGQQTVLLAGHDFKFFPEITSGLQKAGYRVIVDRWGGHDIHDEAQSQRLLAEADVIFCEWGLGNVVWYSRHKRPGQRLVVRIHAQELRKRFLNDADIDAVDAFVFVSPVGMRRAQILFDLPASKCTVIGNTFDIGRFGAYRPTIDRHTLGLVGSVPQSKRLDLALDVIEDLTAQDPAFRLVVKGKEYSEYAWLMSRQKETAYFQEQYGRISDSTALQRAVEFGGHSDDIAEWYRTEPGFILSTSDHEGTHQAIAEGGAAGCIPIIYPWAGAEFVYGDRWMVENTADAVSRIRHLAADPDRFMEESFAVREYMNSHFAPTVIVKQILEVVKG